MLVEFLNPSKFPKTWGKTAQKQPEMVLSVSFRTKRLGFSSQLVRALNMLDIDFTQVQLATNQVVNQDKTNSLEFFLVPCKKDGWILSQNRKTKSFCFSSTSLVNHLKKLWNIEELVNIIKIPVFLEPQVLNDVKCLQINLKHITTISKK